MVHLIDYFTVRTRYVRWTDSRGPRIVVSATLAGKRVRGVFAYDHSESDPHIAAARAFADARGWRGDLYTFRYDGPTPSKRGKVLTLVAPE